MSCWLRRITANSRRVAGWTWCYADSITLRGFVLPQAWRYRDYLIRAFNEDRSFQTMIRQQLAGDLMAAEDLDERASQLVATSFLALGNTNLEEQDKTQLEMDYLDEQLDVLGAAFLGQTIGCARCHDHKFDPIPTRDYYAGWNLRSASGLKHANVSDWIEQPLPLNSDDQQYFAGLEVSQRELQQRLKELKDSLEAAGGKAKRLISVEQLPGIVVDNTHARLVGDWVKSTHTMPIVGTEYIHDGDQGKGQKSATFEPEALPPGEYEVRLAFQHGGNRTSRLVAKVFSADGDTEVEINPRQPPPEQGLWISLGRYRFERNGQAYVLFSNAETDGHVVLDAVQFCRWPTHLAKDESCRPAVPLIANSRKRFGKRSSDRKSCW